MFRHNDEKYKTIFVTYILSQQSYKAEHQKGITNNIYSLFINYKSFIM